MSECDKEFIRHRLETFYEVGEVCDLLGINTEALLNAFEDKLLEYAQTTNEEDNNEER